MSDTPIFDAVVDMFWPVLLIRGDDYPDFVFSRDPLVIGGHR
jgi:hypothetical protein